MINNVMSNQNLTTIETNNNNNDNDNDNILIFNETQIYNTPGHNSFVKFEHISCSLCNVIIKNKLHYTCKTCIDNTNSAYCVCNKCIYNDKNHDLEHTLILCNECICESDNENENENKFGVCAPFVLTPKLLSRDNSNSKLSLRNSLSSKFESILSSNNSKNSSFSKLISKKKKSSCENDISDISNSTPRLVEDGSDLDFSVVKKSLDYSMFKEQVCVVDKLKNRKKTLKQKDDSFMKVIEIYKKTNSDKLFLDKILNDNIELFNNELKNNEFERLLLLSIAENHLTKIDSKIFSLINLTELNIEKNFIKKISEEIGELINLKNLNLNNNLLVDLPYNLSKLKNLHTLSVDYNDFRQIPPVIIEMPELQILYIEGNAELSEFPPEEKLKNLLNLEIHIDNCHKLMAKPPLRMNIQFNCNYPIEIIDKLYLGSYRSTLNEYVYQQLDISVVYTIGREMTPLILKGMAHKIYILDDFSESNINFDILDSIYENIQNNNNCLIHCQMGISRSSTIVIAYLMKFCNMPLQEAYHFVSCKKKNIYPNDGFLAQLNILNSKLYHNEQLFNR